MSYLALDKWARVIRMTIQNGGLFKSLYKIWRMDTLKEGKYIGCDEFGNKYYENKNYMLGRSRWVEYNPQFKWDYDASQVTPEWFGWLHYKTDRLPSEDCAKLCLKCCCWTHRWRLPHTENMSATERAYYPFRTTRTQISVWDGHSICNRPCFPL